MRYWLIGRSVMTATAAVALLAGPRLWAAGDAPADKVADKAADKAAEKAAEKAAADDAKAKQKDIEKQFKSVLRSNDPIAIQGAIRDLPGQLPADRALALVAPLLGVGEPGIACEAARAIGLLGSPQAADVLAGQLPATKPGDKQRECLLKALKDAATPASVTPIRKMLQQEKDPATVVLAVEALGAVKGTNAQKAEAVDVLVPLYTKFSYAGDYDPNMPPGAGGMPANANLEPTENEKKLWQLGGPAILKALQTLTGLAWSTAPEWKTGWPKTKMKFCQATGPLTP